MSMLLNSLQFSDCDEDEMIYNSESVIFGISILADDLRQQILLLQTLVNDHVRWPFQQWHLRSAASLSLNLIDSLSGRTSGNQERINHLLDEAQMNLESWSHSEVEENTFNVATIDLQLLQDTSTADEDIILKLRENVDISLTVDDLATTFSVI